MASIDDIEDKNKGFFQYVFNFDTENKNLLMNLYQYSFITIPFVLISLKLLNHFSPDVNEEKGSLDILFEIFISINWIILTIWFTNKIVRFIPTRSGMPYHIFNETNFIIALLVALFTMNTKLGNKINILIERLVNLYDGKTNLKNSSNNIKQQNEETNNIVPHIIPASNEHTNKNHNIPNVNNINLNSHHHTNSNNQPINNNNTQSTQPSHNFNNSFSGPNINDMIEPSAANEVLGGSFGGSFF